MKTYITEAISTVPMEEKPTAAFILSLIGGVLILLPSLFIVGFYRWYGWGHMMGWNMMGWGMLGFPGIVATVGLISGIIVLLGSIMLYTRPNEATLWGTLIVVFSAISLIGMGGFFIGFLLALIGGILALVWKPK